jgi:hypothetical protein
VRTRHSLRRILKITLINKKRRFYKSIVAAETNNAPEQGA